MRRSRHCPLCAGALTLARPPLDDRPRLVCSACGFVLYLNPKVAAGTIAVDDAGRVALIRRGIEPGRGLWSWPCGYVEMDESVDRTAVRETREECGLDVELDGVLGVYGYPCDHPEVQEHGTGLVIVCYRARVVGGTLAAGDDADDARWAHPHELPWPLLAFESSWRGLRDHVVERGLGEPPAYVPRDRRGP